MLERLPIDLIVEIGILAGPDEYEELAKTSKRNAIILQKPYIVRATSELIVKVTYTDRVEMIFQGRCHSFNDQPAIMYPYSFFRNGTKMMWYKHGKVHRDNDQPAVIYSNGTKMWYKHGEFHRDNDQPSIIWSSGTIYWHQHGKLHRDNDNPAVINADGTKTWYQYGQYIK
jgi:hypothetical protein